MPAQTMTPTLPDADPYRWLPRRGLLLAAAGLVLGGWAKVLGDEQLKSDSIHANAHGYRVFTEGLLDTSRKVGLLR